MYYNLIILFILIFIIIYFLKKNINDNFCNCARRNKIINQIDNFTDTNSDLNSDSNSDKFNYPYNPNISTPQSNYNNIISQINKQNKYKSNLSLGLSSIPTIQCDHMDKQNLCNNYGCNWFDGVCSATYPIVY